MATAAAFLRRADGSAALAGSVSSGREEPGAAVTALLADLVNRGHVTVRSAGGADWLVVCSRGHAGQFMPLTGYERKLLHGLFPLGSRELRL